MGLNTYIQDRIYEGQNTFTADGFLDHLDITHNAGYIPTSFVLTPLTPISLNHLSRSVTFPTVNTMRITFVSPPVLGDNITYSWQIHSKQ